MALGLGHQRLTAKSGFPVAAAPIHPAVIARHHMGLQRFGGAYPRHARDVVAPISGVRYKRCLVFAFKTEEAPIAVAAPGPETSLAHPSGLVRYRFVVPQYVTTFGQSLRVVGSMPELGNWDPCQAPVMHWSEGHQWSLERALPQQSFEFKIIVADGQGITWEGGSNRVVLAEGEDADVPVEIVVWLTCNFNATTSTQLQLAVPRASIRDAYETGMATLEFLRLRRSKLGQDAEQTGSEVDRRQQAAELARLAEAVAEQSNRVHQLGDMLGRDTTATAGRGEAGRGAGRSGSSSSSEDDVEEENQVLLLAIDSVQVPRVLRRISFVQSSWQSGPAALPSGPTAAAAADAAAAQLASPFLRGELDSRAEELMSAAEEMLQVSSFDEGEDDSQDAARRSLDWAGLAQEAEGVASALAALGAGTEACRATQLQMRGLASFSNTLAGGSSNIGVVDVPEGVPAVGEAPAASQAREVGSGAGGARPGTSSPAAVAGGGGAPGGGLSGSAILALTLGAAEAEMDVQEVLAPAENVEAHAAAAAAAFHPIIDGLAIGAPDGTSAGGAVATGPPVYGSESSPAAAAVAALSGGTSTHPGTSSNPDGVRVAAGAGVGAGADIGIDASPGEELVPRAHPLQQLAAAVKDALRITPTPARESGAAYPPAGPLAPPSPGGAARPEAFAYAATDGPSRDPVTSAMAAQGQQPLEERPQGTPWSRIRTFLDRLFL